MPEGDTVWHTATILRDALAGKTLTRCDVRVPKFATVDLTGQVVDEVISRGKHLFIRVGRASIHSHLKMEGSWKVNPVSKPSRAGHRIRIILEAGDIQAAGIDLGVLEVLEREHDMDAVAHLGPDLLGDDWDPHVAAANLVADPDRRAVGGAARPAGDGRRRQRLLQRTVLRHRAPAHRSGQRASRTRCGWCSGPGTCCGSTALGGIAPRPGTPGAAASCGSTAGRG